MKPHVVDFLTDVSYGLLLLAALVMALVGEGYRDLGIAFGLGALAAWGLHLFWKMGRYDPEWMQRTVQEELDESVEDQVQDRVQAELDDSVEDRVQAELDEEVADQVSEAVEEELEESEIGPVPDDVEDEIKHSVEDQLADHVEEEHHRAGPNAD